ncbi:hypothetical protein SK128_001363 [Halocaridina rubra]|uniref:Uncharacterized protein n=1 Tax=Halocaridina rubra TaxID=373956 RepID=A0AAN8WHH5_HALRR
MKFLLLSILVGLTTAQGPLLSQLGQICGNLDPNTCRQRIPQCIKLRRSAEDAQANRQGIMICAQELGITRQQIVAAMQASANSEGGEIFDNLPVDRNTVLNMRRCVFTQAGLADANGNPNHDAIRARLASRFQTLLADNPQMQEVMLNALETCPRPQGIEDAQVFRSCLAGACVQNFA